MPGRIGTARQFRNMRVLAKEIVADGQTLYNPSYGRNWFVDAKNGSDSNGGTSWDAPFLTMDAAFDSLGSGDTIYFVGKVKEQLVSPVGVFDVKIIGASTAPRHADDHTEGGSVIGSTRGSSAATWTAPASGSTTAALLRVQQQGWYLANFVFQISGSATMCLQAYKTDDSGDDERDGGHLNCVNVRFVGDNDGIGFHRSGGNGYCRIIGCAFQNLADGIGHTAGTGGQDGFQLIEGNWFESNTNSIDSPLYRSRVVNNYFFATASGNVEVDLTGGARNIVTENYFLGGGFEENIAGTGDLWFNNYSVDSTSADVADAAAAGAGQIIATPNGS